MAIERMIRPFSEDDVQVSLVELEEGMDRSNPPVVVEMDDGGVTVDFGGADEEPSEVEESFDANLAELIDEDELKVLGLDLIAKYKADKQSRSDWEETYTRGMDLLGLKFEDRTVPWDGASGVFHPMLAEAVVRFQAQAISGIFPASGPVKAAVVGKQTKEKDDQAHRVQDYMNYYITERMPEYRIEMERLLFGLPIAGSSFKKVYPEPITGRAVSMYVPAEDLVASYACSSLKVADRITHVMRKSPNEVRRFQISGFYKDVLVPEPPTHSSADKLTEKKDEMTGRSPSYNTDGRHVLLEVHVELDLPGYEHEQGLKLPYVVTIEENSNIVLSIRRNWKEGDPSYEKRQHFVQFDFIPGLGFYGFGLVHLIGGLVEGSTSLLRQLIDAGTLSNLPGGLKTRGLRIRGDDTPINPGEWRDVDVPGGTIAENLFPMPYKEPSGTLYNLLGNLVEDGRRFASMADLKVSDMNNEAPVGTTLAIMERAMQVQSSVQARLHASLRQEFKLLAEIIRDYGDAAYPYEVEPSQEIKESDFDDRVDVLPVSDPHASTLAQRIMQYQAALQLSSQAPQLYDLQVLHRQVMETLGVPDPDKVVPEKDMIPPADPVTENMNILNLKPVKSYEYQDHEAHLRVHMTLVQDPQIMQQMQNNPSGPAIQGHIDSHIREHLGFVYRRQIEEELGVPLPPFGEPIPADVEKRLSTLIADAADNLLGRKTALAKAEKDAAMQQDPVIQQKQQELAIKQQEVQRKARADEIRRLTEQDKLTQQEKLKLAELQSEEKIAAARIQQAAESDRMRLEQEKHYHETGQVLEGMKLGVEVAKETMGDKRGNNSD